MRQEELFKCSALAGFIPMLLGCNTTKTKEIERPNIIFIFTDQQNARMMSCAGNKYLKTPAMDYIAGNGIRFTHAYAANPVSSPARVSMMTGRFAGTFYDDEGNQVRENTGSMKITRVPEEITSTTIAAYLKKAGYDLAYGGKEHLPVPLNAAALGFMDISDNERDILSDEAAKYINGEHKNPYFLMVSFINPHDICYMAIRDFASTEQEKRLVANGVIECTTLDKALQMPEGISEQEFFEKYCPPLPPNYEPQEGEPAAIKSLIARREFRKNARDHYTENDWRRHRWAYCRLTEMVDNEVQVILDAIRESGQERNTLIIFSSDHGDNDASHRLEHKTTLYEESANVPFLAMWKGHIRAGQVDDNHLVSIGLDLLPTVCDYAGKEGVADPRGKSLRPLFERRKVDWRETLGVESEIGRMVINKDNLKYIKYDAAGIEEQLLDLKRDPFETTQFTNDPDYKEKLADLRRVFETEWFPGY
jgi:arylsulfatase A-like enzyme